MSIAGIQVIRSPVAGTAGTDTNAVHSGDVAGSDIIGSTNGLQHSFVPLLR